MMVCSVEFRHLAHARMLHQMQRAKGKPSKAYQSIRRWSQSFTSRTMLLGFDWCWWPMSRFHTSQNITICCTPAEACFSPFIRCIDLAGGCHTMTIGLRRRMRWQRLSAFKQHASELSNSRNATGVAAAADADQSRPVSSAILVSQQALQATTSAPQGGYISAWAGPLMKHCKAVMTNGSV